MKNVRTVQMEELSAEQIEAARLRRSRDWRVPAHAARPAQAPAVAYATSLAKQTPANTACGPVPCEACSEKAQGRTGREAVAVHARAAGRSPA